MIGSELDLSHMTSRASLFFHSNLPMYFPLGFELALDKLKRWEARFPHIADESIFNDLYLIYILASKKFLTHRKWFHIFRLVLSTYFIRKKIARSVAFYPNQRCLEIRWIPTSLNFSFTSKNVLGCLVGTNILDRYELLDKENVVFALKKLMPELKLVEDSTYSHPLQQESIKLFYFEIENARQSTFSLESQGILKRQAEEKIRNSFEKLSPTVYMWHNEEEIYKNILALSNEIQTLDDKPQACITLDEQTGTEIIFCITLVYRSPSHRFSLKNYFTGCLFVSKCHSIVKQIEDHPIEAHVFRLHIPREASLLRSDSSLDFYFTRKKVTFLIQSAVGEFRDYNGGLIVKQHALLHSFKETFAEIEKQNSDLLETFFYGLTPIENQATLQLDTLCQMFSYFLENWKQEIPSGSAYLLRTEKLENNYLLFVRGSDSFVRKTISMVLQEHSFHTREMAYSFIELKKECLFTIVLQAEAKNSHRFIQSLQRALNHRDQKSQAKQTLNIALDFSLPLDPRMGGDNRREILCLLFEGLTRFNHEEIVENALAESVQISPDGMEYIFKLRPSVWNDGSALTAYDFEYGWKRNLSPDFQTPFASFFYPIKNAKEAKEGKVSINQVGIYVQDERTLKVQLAHPAHYFLQLTANPLYSPVYKGIDHHHPNWQDQIGKKYPCNGPFQLKINQSHQGYVFVRNPLYWDAHQITLDEITLTIMNPTQAIQAFQRKEVDWIGRPYGVWDPSYLNADGNHMISYSDKLVCWLVFNTTNALFKSSKVRRAFSYVIQRAKIVSEAGLSLFPAYSPVPHSDEHSPIFYPEFDKNQAFQLLHEGLAELGLSIEQVPPLELTYYEKGVQKQAAYSLQQQFEEGFGIRCNLCPFSWTEFFQKMRQGEFQLGLTNWTSCLNDPMYTLNAFKWAEQDVNFPKWENPEFQRLLDISEQKANPLEYLSYLKKAEEILCGEMPIIPLVYQPQQAMTRLDLSKHDRSPCRVFNIVRNFYQGG
jgi:oligopeptide transport system substrate-binding protein